MPRRMELAPLQIRLIRLRAPFDQRVTKSSIGQNDMIRLAVFELLANHKTPEATIAAYVRYRQEMAKRNAKKPAKTASKARR